MCIIIIVVYNRIISDDSIYAFIYPYLYIYILGKPINKDILDGEEKARMNAKPHVCFYCPNYNNDILKNNNHSQKLYQFYRILSICHDVIPEKNNCLNSSSNIIDNGDNDNTNNSDHQIKYSASNPDDEALIYAAKYFGYEFMERHDKKIIIKNLLTTHNEEIIILHTIAFTSKRKRMSVIIKDNDNNIKILTKGADTIMLPRLGKGQDKLIDITNQHIQDFALEGLRCLVIASCIISNQDYKKWSDSYIKATTDLNQIELMKSGMYNLIEELEDQIEQNLMLHGATAIEDRLQDG